MAFRGIVLSRAALSRAVLSRAVLSRAMPWCCALPCCPPQVRVDEFYSRLTLAQVEEERHKEKERRQMEEERRKEGKDGDAGGRRDRDRRGRHVPKLTEQDACRMPQSSRDWGLFFT